MSSASENPGRLYGVSVGPGDPDLMTVRAIRTIRSCPVVAYFCKRGTSGHARRIASDCITAEHIELPLVYPVTVELPPDHPDYGRQIEVFFDESAERLAEHLAAGRSVAALNEGDAFFYGSFMHLFLRLSQRFPTEVVPGVTSMMCSASLLPRPLMLRDDLLTVIPGTLSEDALLRALTGTDAAVIMKLGQNLPKVRRAVLKAGLADRAWYIERASMENQRVLPFAQAPDTAPYFSQIVIPGEGKRR